MIEIRQIVKFVHSTPKKSGNLLNVKGISFRYGTIAGLLLLSLILLQTLTSGFSLFSRHSIPGGDEHLLYFWLFKSSFLNLISQPVNGSGSGFPCPDTHLWNDLYLLPSFLAWPLTATGVDPALTYKIVIVLFILAGSGFTFLICHGLSGSLISALASTLSFSSLFTFLAVQRHPESIGLTFLPATTYVLMLAIQSRSFLFLVMPGLLLIPTAFISRSALHVMLIFLPLTILVIKLIRSTSFRQRELLLLSGSYCCSLLILIFCRILDSGGLTSGAPPVIFQLPGPLSLLSLILGIVHLLKAPFLRLPLICFAGLLVTSLLASQPLAVISAWAAVVLISFISWRLGRAEESSGCHVLTSRSLFSVFFTVMLGLYAFSQSPSFSPLFGDYSLLPIAALIMSSILVSVSLPRLITQSSGRMKAVIGVLLLLAACYEYTGSQFVRLKAPSVPAALEQVSRNLEGPATLLTLPPPESGKDRLNIMHWAFDSGMRSAAAYSSQGALPDECAMFSRDSKKTIKTIPGRKYLLTLADYPVVGKIHDNFTLVAADPEGNRVYEANEIIKLSDDYRMFLPATCNRLIRLELMSRKTAAAAPHQGDERIAIGIKYNQVEISEALSPPDNTWNIYSILLPCDRSHLPGVVSFRLPSSAEIYLRSSEID